MVELRRCGRAPRPLASEGHGHRRCAISAGGDASTRHRDIIPTKMPLGTSLLAAPDGCASGPIRHGKRGMSRPPEEARQDRMLRELVASDGASGRDLRRMDMSGATFATWCNTDAPRRRCAGRRPASADLTEAVPTALFSWALICAATLNEATTRCAHERRRPSGAYCGDADFRGAKTAGMRTDDAEMDGAEGLS